MSQPRISAVITGAGFFSPPAAVRVRRVLNNAVDWEYLVRQEPKARPGLKPKRKARKAERLDAARDLLEAYRRLEASGGLSPLRLLVARDIAEHGPTTQTETTARLSAGKAQRFNNTYQPRFAELERFGVIAAVGEKACALTGRMEVAWELTGNLPVRSTPAPDQGPGRAGPMPAGGARGRGVSADGAGAESGG